MLLISNGRVLDPASGDGCAPRHPARWRSHRRGRAARPARGARQRCGNFRRQEFDRRARLYRFALPSSRAGRRILGNHRNRHARGGARRLHRRMPDAEYAPGERQRIGDALDPRARRRGCERARVADRRGVGGKQRRSAFGNCGDEAGRNRRGLRRRPAHRDARNYCGR